MFDFGITLREKRKNKKLTQKQLATKIDVSEATISKYESNLVYPPFEKLRSLSSVLGISLDELCGMKPPEMISLYNLSTLQKEIVDDLIVAFREKNEGLNIYKEKSYAVLGKITAEILSK